MRVHKEFVCKFFECICIILLQSDNISLYTHISVLYIYIYTCSFNLKCRRTQITKNQYFVMIALQWIWGRYSFLLHDVSEIKETFSNLLCFFVCSWRVLVSEENRSWSNHPRKAEHKSLCYIGRFFFFIWVWAAGWVGGRDLCLEVTPQVSCQFSPSWNPFLFGSWR